MSKARRDSKKKETARKVGKNTISEKDIEEDALLALKWDLAENSFHHVSQEYGVKPDIDDLCERGAVCIAQGMAYYLSMRLAIAETALKKGRSYRQYKADIRKNLPPAKKSENKQ